MTMLYRYGNPIPICAWPAKAGLSYARAIQRATRAMQQFGEAATFFLPPSRILSRKQRLKKIRRERRGRFGYVVAPIQFP